MSTASRLGASSQAPFYHVFPAAACALGRLHRRLGCRHGTFGQSHLYQSRCTAFPDQVDANLVTACRYVGRNPPTRGCWFRSKSATDSEMMPPADSDVNPARA